MLELLQNYLKELIQKARLLIELNIARSSQHIEQLEEIPAFLIVPYVDLPEEEGELLLSEGLELVQPLQRVH